MPQSESRIQAKKTTCAWERKSVSLGLCGAKWGVVVKHAADRGVQPLDRRETASGDPQTPAGSIGLREPAGDLRRPGNRSIVGLVHGGGFCPLGRSPGPGVADAAGCADVQPAVLRAGAAGGIGRARTRANSARAGRAGPVGKRSGVVGSSRSLGDLGCGPVEVVPGREAGPLRRDRRGRLSYERSRWES